MKVTVISIIVGILGTVPQEPRKDKEVEIQGKIETAKIGKNT